MNSSAASKDAIVEQFKAIAHPLRLRILEVLATGELNVGEIEQATGIAQPGLSQQLGVLRKAGLVETRKDAKLVFYRMAPAAIDDLGAALSALYPADAAPAATCAATPAASSAAGSVSGLASGPASGVANFARLS